MRAMKLVLFDIDNTLVKTPKSHMLAFLKAIKDIYGIDISSEEFKKANTPGMVDPEIVFLLLENKGINKEFIRRKLSLCLKRIEELFSKYLVNEPLTLLPGVTQLLKILTQNDAVLGIVTGNLESIAWAKLKKARIATYFTTGGFGSDLKERAELVNLAIKRIEEYFKKPFPNSSVYLIGDTPRDVIAGKKAGVNTIAVATGTCTKEMLEKTGADLVVENLLEDKLLKYLN